MTLPIPTEEVEQQAVVMYCRMKNYPHFRVPNETYTKSWNQRRKNTALGVSSGVPDLFVIVGNRLIAIEMKRLKDSKTTPQQKDWLERLNQAGIPARICKGAEAAINFIEDIAHGYTEPTSTHPADRH